MSRSVFAHFGQTVDDYDTVADAVVYKNDELHQALIDALPFEENSEISILDVGCGTGHGMQLVTKRFHRAKLVGVDFSARMISKARARFNGEQRIVLVEEDIRDFEPSTQFDAVISAMTIHNFDDDQKLMIFTKVMGWLRPNGVFVNADFYRSESPAVNQQLKLRYLEYVKTHLSGAELSMWLVHISGDRPMTLSRQIQELRKAGFHDLSLRWLFLSEAVYSARSPMG